MSSTYQKQCPRCGVHAPLAAPQCVGCGHAFRTRFRKECPSCSRSADLDATYCQGCGHLYRTPFPAGTPTPRSQPEGAPAPVWKELPPAVSSPEPEPEPLPEPETQPYVVPPGILSQIFTPNPWLDLVPGRAPYFAPIDLAVLERHLATSGYPGFDGSVPPEPFMGDPQAPILLLDEGPPRPGSMRIDPTDPELAERWTANLRHAPLAYPLYPVDPVIGQRFGSGSLARSLAYWLAVYGAERVSRSFFQVHLCPYPSLRLPDLAEPLPSRAYSLELARTKVRSGCLTLLLAGADQWEALIPELKQSGHRLLRPGVRSLSPHRDGRRGNLAPETTAALHQILGGAVRPL